MSRESHPSPWLGRFALLSAVATLLLLGIGGVVTSRGAGMAVPDWPTSYGYNMFFFPFSYWMGGIFYEHSHRLLASFVGLLVVALTRWLGGRASRRPLAIIGIIELVAGIVLVQMGPDWKGTGHFLAGIGGVVLLAAAAWFRNVPAPKPLPLLGWIAFFGVQFQGLLGGLRVVLFKNEIGIFHATLAQLFFVLICLIALLSSPLWPRFRQWTAPSTSGFRGLVTAMTGIILLQLIIGATMRHQHAGLAIPDFPLAYGQWWPAIDSESVATYNSQRLEVTAQNPITAAHVVLQMIHRMVAVLILVGVGFVTVRAWRRLGSKHPFTRICLAWSGLMLVQATLGAATIWSNKAADLATAHVIFGALSLALGGLASFLAFQPSQQVQPVITPVAGTVPRASLGQHPSGAMGTI